ncbi:unnamed protein product [Macrosiphum euphorbiae]|uniref:HAT C-terminal dimerisation domain-containing protein n=1 Tax=Macrosiphum euphorbiae TaxID=13131 RepID=A0AAV0VWT8_9HEMI|nr:unnamed protein product [Macrosiphum euphorbiae]
MNENETKKRIRNCVFNDEWLKDQIFSDWIAKHNNPNKARCILCQTVFSVKYDGVKAVKTHQESKKHEGYIWFVHHVLSIFQKHILILEKNNLNAPEVYDVMLSLRSQILNRKNDNFFGIAVTTRLPNLTSKENDAFKSDALHTYKRALEYLEKWFDYENSPFKMFSCLKLSELPKLTDLLDLAKLIKVHVNGDELYEELNLIKLLPNDILNNTEFTSSEKWVKFFQSSTAQLKNIKQIVQYVFSVPCSNAFVERVFSHMNSLWTDERNRLGIDTVKAELVIRNNITYNCSEFFDQIQNEKHLLNAVKNAAKYKFKRPKWLPFVGNTYQLSKLAATKNGQYLAFEELRQRYKSDIIGLKLGREYIVTVFGNDLVNETLHRDEFQGRPDNFFMRLRTLGKRRGITMTDGDLWKVHRSFAVRHLKLLGLGQRRVDELIRDEYQLMVERLSVAMKSVTPTLYLQSAVMNVLWELTAGTKFEDPELLTLMGKRSSAFNMVGGLLNQIPWLRYLAPTKTGFSLITDINQQIYSLISNIIVEHKKTITDTTRDFIDAYLHQMKKEEIYNTMFTEEQLIAVCLDLFIAGSSTTSSTLDFAILAMARWPDVQAKVQSTLDEIQPPGTYITAEQILKNRYVEAVLLETKRLNHVTPIIGPRRVLRNTNLNGYNIPKNTTILMSLYSVHQDQLKWGDPEVFRPERFMDTNGKINKTEEMYFFGFGKRRCPGEALAQRFVNLAFANLIHDFIIEIDQLPEGVNCGILLTPKPYKIKMTKRK